MKKKQDNNLILVEIGDEKYYFTSWSRAGDTVGFRGSSQISYNFIKNRSFEVKGRKATVKLVDGSKVPYELINNEIEKGE